MWAVAGGCAHPGPLACRLSGMLDEPMTHVNPNQRNVSAGLLGYLAAAASASAVALTALLCSALFCHWLASTRPTPSIQIDGPCSFSSLSLPGTSHRPCPSRCQLRPSLLPHHEPFIASPLSIQENMQKKKKYAI